jgi:2-polyprenyl-3-methyl-5-hydroxy-6-metoxy-1,4-benzoquinol methylase
MGTEFEQEQRLAAFNQNHEAFRSLNQQMWQIPLISMTLTGGLWFGVSTVGDNPVFKLALLGLACVGNLILLVVIHRLRFVMDGYLCWLETFDVSGFVKAEGTKWYQKSKVVRTCFQIMLALAGTISAVLCVVIGVQTWKQTETHGASMTSSIRYYDRYAEDLANGYEALSLEDAHPALLKMLAAQYGGKRLVILDIGAGTGRDASGLAAMGHDVTTVEPSISMQKIGQRIHTSSPLRWVVDSLPKLDVISSSPKSYDLILLSAVWMHLAPEDRKPAIIKLISLMNSSGTIYVTLRIGPEEKDRGIYKISAEEFSELASSCGLTVQQVDQQRDLLGRQQIEWKSFSLTLPTPITKP